MTWFRTVVCRCLGTALTAAMVTLVAPQPAPAGITDCFTAIAPVGQIGKATEIAAKAGGCVSQASGDPLMAMTIAALIAAAGADQFSTSDECKGAINGAVGHLIAEALLQVMPAGYAKDLLQDFVDGKLPVTFSDLLFNIPGGQLLSYYIECGCSVAGAKGDAEQLAKEYVQAAKECANFLGDAKDAVLGFFGGVGESIDHWLHGTPMHEGVQQEQVCYSPTVLPDGFWTEKPITTVPLYPNEPVPYGCAGALICAPGHVVIEQQFGAKKLNKCSANCPASSYDPFTPGDKCAVKVNWTTVNKVCKPVHMAHCCGDGQAMFELDKCSPVCGEGQGLQNGECAPCKPWQKSALNQCHDICSNGVFV